MTAEISTQLSILVSYATHLAVDTIKKAAPILLARIVEIAEGVFMVLMGINMLSLFPWISKLFSIFRRKKDKEKTRSSKPFIVGLLNGFMPCGPLQSMWLVALATASPLKGAISMLLFSLGTVPLMVFFGSIFSLLGYHFKIIENKLVIVLGLSMMGQGGSLSGFLPPDLLLYPKVAFFLSPIVLSIRVRRKMTKATLATASIIIIAMSILLWSFQGRLISTSINGDSSSSISQRVQIIEITLSSGRYPNITVKAGLPFKWYINTDKE